MSTDELGPCPSCGEKQGDIRERKGSRFPFYVICKACTWMTRFVKLRSVAIGEWNNPTKV